ncbi:MAG: lactonase family protein [Sphingobacteriaceae bacterium]|nr:lactonase family protein [Sphingobacteriaceae bacterium]
MKLQMLIALSLIGATPATHAQTKFNLLIGTYTNPGKSEGIYVYEFDSQTGALSYKNKVGGIKNPTFLAISPDENIVYAVNSQDIGNIFSYKFDRPTGSLEFQSKQPAGGDNPCYVAVDSHSRYVFSGNYGGGSLSAIPLNKDGSLAENSQVIKHEGSSIDPERQDKPYVHSVVLSPDEHFLFVQDLGTDKLYNYKFDPNAPVPLTPAGQATVSVTPGSGPRHIIFHPKKKLAYVIHEMGGIISSFHYNDGELSPIEVVSMAAPGFTGEMRSAAIHISSDGKFLYGSNRGEANNIVIYSIDEKTGQLTLVGRQSAIGKGPRDFAIDPTGNFMLIANQDSNDIYVLKRDKKTGIPSETVAKIDVFAPVCLKFASVK